MTQLDSPGLRRPIEAGLTCEPYRLAVELGKVREFARATKAADPRYWSQARPFLPPTFLVTNAFWLQPGSWALDRVTADGAALDWARLLSGGSEFSFYGTPLRAGETLVATQRVDDVYAKQGQRGGAMTFIVFTTTFARPDGSVAATERHTTIQTGRESVSGPGAGPARVTGRAVATAPAPASRQVPGSAETAAPGLERPRSVPDGADRLCAGDQLPRLIDDPVSVTDIVRYQGASGDLNPIHHDHQVATAAGFPGVFSVGMLHAGILGSYLSDLFGPERIRRYGVEFREQVWPGDVLTYCGEVTRRREGAGSGAAEIDLSLTATRHLGGSHLRAWATVTVGSA